MRRLIYIPMLHSEESIRSHEDVDEVSKDTIISSAKDYLDKYWGLVFDVVKRKDWKDVRLYMEGVSERLEVPTGLFDNYSGYAPEHVLMKNILSGGGVIEYTEDQELFSRRGALFQKISELSNDEGDLDGAEELISEFSLVVDESDAVIAKRIDETLQEGETGVLAIGAMHDVGSKLPSDIYVELIDKEIGEILKEIDPSLEVKINPEISRS